MKVNTIFRIIHDLRHVLYPDLCMACNSSPKAADMDFCIECSETLPFTDHFDQPDNEVSRHFIGRVGLKACAALFFMPPDSPIHGMIHRLKYKGKGEYGLSLGAMIGKRLLESPLYGKTDLLIPIPITHLKKLKRGYNQSERIATGISGIIEVAVNDRVIIKTKNTKSQTGMNRTARVENVKDTFSCLDGSLITGKHILLVDDVVTTGATIESCASVIIAHEPASLSLVAIGSAQS
jgi:ComF family protein